MGITQDTNLIYQIWVTADFKNKFEAEEEIEKLVVILKKKYNESVYKGRGGDYTDYRFISIPAKGLGDRHIYW